MNNKFKFRAWYYDKDDENDLDNNKMFYDAQDTYDGFCGNPPLPASSFGDIIDDERWVVEQCTGTKDKNGKLVYEGDFIKTPSGAIGYIVWSQQDLAFMTKDLNPKEKEVYLAECEVIGNIHENIDLLEIVNE